MDVQAVELATTYGNLGLLITSIAPVLVVGLFYEKFMILSSLLLVSGFVAVTMLFSAAHELRVMNCSPSSDCLEFTGFALLPILTTVATFFWVIFKIATSPGEISYIHRGPYA